MARDAYVRIGEAARLAGVSIDTLRRWEREGKLSATRTFGGQRTYSSAEIESRRDNRETVPEDESPEGREEPPGETVTPPSVHPWKAREANAAADLSVTRLKIERREEIRRSREEDQSRIVAQRAESEARAAEARLSARRQSEREGQQKALDSCIHTIRIRLIAEPPEARAEVERFLANHAGPGDSVEWVKAEVEAILDRRRAERIAATQRQTEIDRRRFEEAAQKLGNDVSLHILLAHGERLARSLTSAREEWSPDAAEDAIEEVRKQLAEIVEPTWTERRVEREVRDILAEWD